MVVTDPYRLDRTERHFWNTMIMLRAHLETLNLGQHNAALVELVATHAFAEPSFLPQFNIDLRAFLDFLEEDARHHQEEQSEYMTEQSDGMALAHLGDAVAALVDQLIRGSHPPKVYQMLNALEAMRAAAPFIPAGVHHPAGQVGHLDVATIDQLIAQVKPQPSSDAEPSEKE